MYRASRRACCDRAIWHGRRMGHRIRRHRGRRTGRCAAARRAACLSSVDDEYFFVFFSF